MADKKSPTRLEADPSSTYEITIKGHLDEYWKGWFGDLEVSYDPNGFTILSGFVADQSALHGILTKIWGLNLTLISIIRLGNQQ